MNHTGLMSARLPFLYQQGELVGQLLDQYAIQLGIADEEATDIRRSHWFEEALELSDAARLGALLDLPPQDWQNLDLYRVWVEATRDATLDNGAVTVKALQDLVQRYCASFQDAVGFTLVPELVRLPGNGPAPAWRNAATPGELAFVEFPDRRRTGPAAGAGAPVAPLTTFSLTNKGLDPTPLSVLVTGVSTGPEYVPVLANLTTGQTIAFLGPVRPGERLWLRSQDNSLTAHLESRDVTDRLWSIASLTPGIPWESAQVSQPAAPLILPVGENRFWFLTVAHFNVEGLGRALSSLAGLDVHQGVFDQTNFDASLFTMDSAVILEATWVETQPASVDIYLPGGRVLAPTGRTGAALVRRGLLARSLAQAVDRLRPAGVATQVLLEPFTEVATQSDFLVQVEPVILREAGSVGADSLPDPGGLFDVTRFEGSTFR